MKFRGGSREQLKLVKKEDWEPKTAIGRMVKDGKITELKQIFEMGKKILEPEIVDILVPNLEAETIQIKSTQRATGSGRRAKFRIVVVVGNKKGYVGLGVGKSEEIRPAIAEAVRNAKKNMIYVPMGCGSWECRCSDDHSIPQKTIGKESTTVVVLKPAPKGVRLAANHIIKVVLRMAGVKDVWSYSKGNSNVYATAMATIKALDNLNHLRPKPVKEAA